MMPYVHNIKHLLNNGYIATDVIGGIEKIIQEYNDAADTRESYVGDIEYEKGMIYGWRGVTRDLQKLLNDFNC